MLLQDMLVKQIEGHTICALGDAGGLAYAHWQQQPVRTRCHMRTGSSSSSLYHTTYQVTGRSYQTHAHLRKRRVQVGQVNLLSSGTSMHACCQRA